MAPRPPAEVPVDPHVHRGAGPRLLRAITAPTLLIKAGRTTLVEDYYPRRIAAVPNLRQVTLPGSHHLHIENADPVAAVIRQFLAEEQKGLLARSG